MEHTAKTMKASMEDPDHQSTQSGALIGSNDDLLTEILLRLPVTSILRFKSVSKHWHWLLSDKHFTQSYDKLLKSPGLFATNTFVPFDVENPNPPPFLSFSVDAEKRSTTRPFRTLDFYFNRHGVKILQSCNGLLLCSTDVGPKGGKAAPTYYVFNPTTKQLALIPPVPRRMKIPKSACFMALAYHQTDCVHYKVVRVTSLKPFGGPGLYQIQIYSSDTRKWKICIQSFYVTWNCFHQVVYWNGAVHWAPYYNKFFYFKIDVEQMQMLPFPVEWMPSHDLAYYLGESRGHLHLIAYKTRQETNLCLNVYEMFSDRSGWFIKYQVQLDALPGVFPDMISKFDDGYCFKVIDVVRGEEEHDTFLVLKSPKNFITYNVRDKSFKQISSFYNYYRDDISCFHRYTETLSSF